MFDRGEMVQMSRTDVNSNTEGALDLSMPKKRNRSDSCSSHEASTSSLHGSSSPSSGDIEDCHSEKENAKDDTLRREFARIECNNSNNNNNNNSNSREIDGEGNHLEDSPPCLKRRRTSQSPNEPSLFAEVCGRTNDHHFDSNINELDLDERPIRRTDRGVSLSLHDESMWNAFRNVGTEMIINRGGRRMFPHVVLSVNGLNSSATYSIFLEIVLADDRRFKYVNNQWMGMGMADPSPRTKAVVHPDSPNLGSYWMQSRISFSKVRLTNNKDSAEENIRLLSMHKYKVVINIRNDSAQYDNILTFVFDESAFIAVTAYQNNRITQLKIQNNPFAKAFRDAPNKQKQDGKKQNGSHLPKLDNDFEAFNISSFKKSPLTSPPKEQYDVLASHRIWHPWGMPGLGSNPGMDHMPHAYDFTSPGTYEALRHLGMYRNPALMAQLSYLPFLSMNQSQFGHQLMRSPAFLNSVYSSSLQSSTKGDTSDDSKEDLDDTDSASKSSHEYF